MLASPVLNDTPTTSLVLWRYMDLYKFLWLLEHSALYFTRADKLGDEFEGSFPETSKELRRKVFADFVTKAEADAKTKNLIPAESPWEMISGFRKWVRQWVWVSCWHSAEAESDAMWRVYGGYASQAIAVRSDFASLQACLPTDTIVEPIKYIDFKKAAMPELWVLEPFKHKRIEFRADQEVRAIVSKIPEYRPGLVVPEGTNTEYGKTVPIDLSKLLKGIHVAPNAQLGFPELLERLLKRYGLRIPVQRSNLETAPIF